MITEAKLDGDSGLSEYEEGVLDGVCQALRPLIRLANAAHFAACATEERHNELQNALWEATEFIDGCK